MYAKYLKRVLDLLISLFSLIVLSPLMVFLTILGAVKMRGNPFFVQRRPGLHEKIFPMIKFRTMNFAKDENDCLLPDKKRITGYGRFLRKTSLDELPELFNILKGDMAIVGPRPLLVKYLPLYNEAQRHRHDVRPGLTGYAQVHGRNNSSWDERFRMDLDYIAHISFLGDLRIILETVKSVLSHSGVDSQSASDVTMLEFTGDNHS